MAMIPPEATEICLDVPEISPLAATIFTRVTRTAKVLIPMAWLADVVGHTESVITHPLNELMDLGLIQLWHLPPEHATRYGDHGTLVTMTELSAKIVGVRLNQSSTRWVPVGDWRERHGRIFRNKTTGGLVVVGEVDLGEHYRMDAVVDHRESDPLQMVAECEASLREAERQGGYPRPIYLDGYDLPWPLDGQDRGPFAPRHEAVPIERIRVTQGFCTGCLGEVGRGAFCLACDLYFAEHRLPRKERRQVQNQLKNWTKKIEGRTKPLQSKMNHRKNRMDSMVAMSDRKASA